MRRKEPFAQKAFKHPLYYAIAAAATCSFNAAADEKILEEVIVTSQKRAQSLQDVPISVAAVTGDIIEKMGIENLEDITAYVPNIHFTETGFSTQMRIRGIGSDNSQGFEQSVGVYMDGIYRSRAQLFRAPIFDVERVEVMRGPQATLFGKNSIAGAVDIITAKPTDEFASQITTSYETEFGTKEMSGFVSGPLNNTLKGRLALRYYDDPGYMINTFKDRDEPLQEEKAVRASLDWAPSSNLNVLFIAERDTFDVQGRAIEVTQDIRNPNPDGSTYSQVLSEVTGGVTFDGTLDYRRQADSPEHSDTTVNSQTLRIDYQMGDISMVAITGLLGYDYLENCNCDYTPANTFSLDLMEDYEQVSQEIRFVSAEGQTIEWLAGAFYQSYDQTFIDNFSVPKGSALLPLLARAGIMLPESFTGSGVRREFDQSSDAWAVFAEATWYASDALDITLGARFTEEDKKSNKVMNVVDITNNNAIRDDSTIAAIYANLFNTDTEQHTGHNLTGERNESAFTPALTLRYRFTDNIMTYAKGSKGYKAGGFDPRSNNPSNYEFEDEKVVAIELGSKMTFAGGRSELNVALFDMAYDNLQISQFDGAVGFNPGNAKDTQVRGLELDGRWQITDSLTAGYGIAYLDFEYKDFTNGNCPFGHLGQAEPCDYTGKRGVYTPEYTVNGSLQYTRELQTGLAFVSNLEMQWIDRQQVHVNLDPHGEMPAHTLLSLRMALEGDNWALALLGKNLLDEDVVTYSGNVTLSELLVGSNTFYSFVRRPRTLAMEATFRF